MADRDTAINAALGLAMRQDGALTTAAAIDAGLTRGQLRELVRSGGWSRPFRGALLVPGAHSVRGPTRAALLVRPDAVTCELTAAWLYGVASEPARDAPIHLLVPAGASRTQPRGGRLTFRWGPPDLDGPAEVLRLPATSPGRTVADVMLTSDRATAVGTLDAALNGRVVPDLGAVACHLVGRPGAERARRWLALGDARSESPLETRLRLLLVDAGIPPEQLQWPVHRDGRIVARLDFAWPSRRVCVEADGVAFHRAEHAVVRDRRRQNDVVAMGWNLLRFTWADVVRRPTEVVSSVAELLRASPSR